MTRILSVLCVCLLVACGSTPKNQNNAGLVGNGPEYESVEDGSRDSEGVRQNATQMRTVQTEAARKIMEQRNANVPKQKIKASSKVKDYNGKPKVKRVGKDRQAYFKEKYDAYLKRRDAAQDNIKKMRVLVYCTEGRSLDSRSGGVGVNRIRASSGKRPKSLVLVDGDPYDFKLAYKNSDYSKLKGSVISVSPQKFDAIVRDLENIGMSSLRTRNYKVGEDKISTDRAIHLVVKGNRMSIFKSEQTSTGTMDSPRAIFTRCEHSLIQLFAPTARGAVDNSKS